jgi:acetolactate synthase I/II/III large subunit
MTATSRMPEGAPPASTYETVMIEREEGIAWVTLMHGAPLITIICNNARWGAVQTSTIGVYPHGHAAAGAKTAPLSDLSPIPDFEKFTEASGGYAERVSNPHGLPDAFCRALQILQSERRQVLLNVLCE